MLPPPTTTATCTPRFAASAISVATVDTTKVFIPKFCGPMRASPEIFSMIRLYAGLRDSVMALELYQLILGHGARAASVRLRPHDALFARLARERTRAGLAADERDATHRDLEIIFDLGLERRIAVVVRHREAAVDRRRIVRLLLRRIGE